MAAISYDGQSFIIDGRRIWLVSGTVHYARVPREQWRDRLLAAKQAGLNCVETAVFWNLHEPTPGEFRFDDGRDIRAFVELVAELDMWCILRVGPFVGDGWDMGGLPAWLLEVWEEATRKEPARKTYLRQRSPAFLQSCARYIDAVMAQVKDLQATQQETGPILLVQNEHEWHCQNDDQAEGYLEQINRFLRESGCDVPVLNRNNLWQQVQGTIDAWGGERHLFTTSRQLRVLQPMAPCMAINLATSSQSTWGEEHEPKYTPRQVAKRILGASASASMVNVNPICAGTNFAFFGGRMPSNDDGFSATTYCPDAPVAENGTRTDLYARVRRICTFLSQFETVMAHLRPDDHQTVAATDLSVVQRSGTQGHAVFLCREPDSEPRVIEVITPDGHSLPIDLGEDRLAWIVIDANLDGVCQLDLTNLRPWAFHEKRMLVVFGPAGSEGITIVDRSDHRCTVPDEGDDPHVVVMDEVTLVVLSEEQVDHAYLHDGGLYVGVDGIDENGDPVQFGDGTSYYNISLEGELEKKRGGRKAKPTSPRTTAWEYAGIDDYVHGTAPRFATLEGPRSLEACAADLGYGWYRVRASRSRAKKVNLLIPEGGDRLHVYSEGKLQALLGSGPGASAKPQAVSLPSGDSDLVILADNMGRFAGGLGYTTPKGIAGHLLDVKTIRLGKAEVEAGPRIDPFELTSFVPESAVDDRGHYQQFTWKFNLAANPEPLILRFEGVRPRSVVTINNRSVAIDVGCNSDHYVVLDEHIKKGSNRLTLGLIDHVDDGFDLGDHVSLYQIVEVLTDEAEWWYARWQLPGDDEFDECPKTTPASPAFYRTTFRVKDTAAPLMLEVSTATKGQLYLNGHNLGRFFVATSTGRKVPPQHTYYLPEAWLNTDDANELLLFDEHGRIPKVKLRYA